MSSKHGAAIPFQLSRELENVRLLELPPALLKSIKSAEPPNLMLKSADNNVSQNSTHAVLCTDDITYQLRQVQSSNSVFVLRPTQIDVASSDKLHPVTSISAIAKCSDTLELLAATTSAKDVLRQALPVYDVETPNAAGQMQHQSKKDLLENLPYSKAEFETSWRELCAFEYNEQAWRPTAQLLACTWKSMLAAAIIRNLSLEDAFPTNAVVTSVEDDGLPVPLLHSLITKLSTADADLTIGYAQLDAEKCIIGVGTMLLESIGHEVQKSNFIHTWQEQLPENWRSRASINLLKGSFSQSSKGFIIYDDSKSSASADQGTSKAAATKSNRRWHEKFKNTRN